MSRKILYISGTRADYGLMREVLFAIDKHAQLSLEIIATGMHLMPEFGNTIREIEKDGFKIHKINAVYDKDDKESVVRFMGELILGLLDKVKEIKPDIVFVQGDRNEMLAGAIAGAYLGIPVAHAHCGETTGTVDETTRHTITKLAHIHLAPTKKAGERVVRMGEDKYRVHFVGAPGLDSILKQKIYSKKEVSERYNLKENEPVLLVVQHPVTAEIEDAGKQIKETMEAVKELKKQAVIIYPNADPGGREMIKVIEQYRKEPNIHIYKSISRKDYLSLMKISEAMIGNSSSGIIEAPSFGTLVVNIGTRQDGRERSDNILDVSYDKDEIKRAVSHKIPERIESPYGDGKASQRIVKILSDLEINNKLLNKKISY